MVFLLERECADISSFHSITLAWTENDFAVLSRNLERLGKHYIEWTKEGRKFYLSPFEVKIASHVNRHCHKKERCELGARQVSVASDGYLYPCVQFTRAGRESAWCIGSVFDGIDEVKREALRIKAESEKVSCTDCAVKERCNNTCGCLNWQTTGNVDTVSPVLCRYERMLFPIADRLAEKLYAPKDPHFLHKHYNAAYPVLSLIEDALPGL